MATTTLALAPRAVAALDVEDAAGDRGLAGEGAGAADGLVRNRVPAPSLVRLPAPVTWPEKVGLAAVADRRAGCWCR